MLRVEHLDFSFKDLEIGIPARGFAQQRALCAPLLSISCLLALSRTSALPTLNSLRPTY